MSCKKAKLLEVGTVSGYIDLDKCSFSLIFQGVDLEVQDAPFGIAFGDFDQTASP